MRATAWRSALFMLGIHAPRATAELLDVTLTRQWDGGLLGFVLEQSETGQLIAEVTPGMAADVDESLQPGDVIITGTPTGAGARFDPPRYLAPGDVVEVEVNGIGTLRNGVEDEAV